jgi:hypothetical protein
MSREECMAAHPAGRLAEVIDNRVEAVQARDVAQESSSILVRSLPAPRSDLGFPVSGDELARSRRGVAS